MSIQTLVFNHVDFQYQNSTNLLFEDLNVCFQEGWTALIGANGGGKSTLLRLATGELHPSSGVITKHDSCVYVEQKTESLPLHYDVFAYAYDALACTLHGRLNLDRDYIDRWEVLSHGERKRAQIGWALYQESDVLCVDEPTNHLDVEAASLVVQALASYHGIGLLVTHDLLPADIICDRTLLVHSPYALMQNCKPSQAIAEMRQQRIGMESAVHQQSRRQGALRSELNRRSLKAGKQDALNTKRNIDPKDHDAKARIDAARVAGMDGKAGRLASQLDRRMARTESLTQQMRKNLFPTQTLDVTKVIDGISIKSEVLRVAALYRSEAEHLSLGPERKLFVPPLVVTPSQTIGIQGPNGSGKSTLLRHLVYALRQKNFRFLHLEQELDGAACLQAFQSFQALEEQEKGKVVSSVARLGSDPRLFLGSALPSPGELRKLLIAQALEDNLNLLVLDEPTNHLDLPSRLALQEAMKAFKGALICISHDEAFLKSVCTTRWVIQQVNINGNLDSVLMCD